MLGNNMFAYCLNNPVNRIDLSGSASIWYYLIIDHDMGFIHRAVVEDIRKNNSSVKTEVTLSNFGRADVVNTNIGAVWEVKHAGKNPLRRTAIAYLQASAYVELNDELSHLGNAGAFHGKIYIECKGLYYEVEYHTPLPGVILYTVNEVSNYNGTVSAVYVPKAERKESSYKSSYRKVFGLVVAGATALIFGAGFAAAGLNDGLLIGSCALY